MNERPNLAALLADPVRAGELPKTAIAALLDELALQEGRCRMLRDLLTAQLTARPASEPGNGDVGLVDDVHEVARLLRRSASWVRKHGHTLPGFHQPGGRGCKVSWSRRALQAWVANGTG